MKKVFTIARKDLAIIFRDRGALLLMLLAPFVLTVAFGIVTGSFSDGGAGGTGLADIGVVIVNNDIANGNDGDIAATLVNLLQSDELGDLLNAEVVGEESAARDQVDADEAAAAVIIPAGFSASLLPESAGGSDDLLEVEVYGGATRQISAGVVRSIVASFIEQTERNILTTELTVTQLIATGAISPAEIDDAIAAISASTLDTSATEPLITLSTVGADEGIAPPGEESFDLLSFLGPGMAILFLMYTVSLGASTFLRERQEGTLPRMMASPTANWQIIGGKMLGIFFTGLAQLGILVLGFRFMLQLDWGPLLPVLLLVVAVVAAATGYGTLLAAFARTPGQVLTFGTALMLLFGIMGGTFTGPTGIPGWLLPLSRLTPNYWGLTGFSELILGGTLTDIFIPIVWLAAIAAVLFVVAASLFRRQFA